VGEREGYTLTLILSLIWRGEEREGEREKPPVTDAFSVNMPV
jgi:hypothetical protein